jgi:hypothetical protein
LGFTKLPVRGLGRDDLDRSLPTSAEVKYEFRSTSTLAFVSMVWIGKTLTSSNTTAKLEMKTLNDIQNKLNQHNATVTKAGKGQTLIIITITDYNTKTHQFLNNVHFKTNKTNPTNTFQKEIKKVINSFPILIPRTTKWKYTTMNPRAPNIRVLIKIHKLNTPIRPLVNWQHAPAYRLAKFILDKLKHELQLPYTFNIQNTQQLITELRNTTDYNQNLRLASFDITNMYTNIPTSKITHIIGQICKHHNHTDQNPI